MPVTREKTYEIKTTVRFSDGKPLIIVCSGDSSKTMSDKGFVHDFIAFNYGLSLESISFQKDYVENYGGRSTYISNDCIVRETLWTDDVVIDIKAFEDFVSDIIEYCDCEPTIIGNHELYMKGERLEELLKNNYDYYFYCSHQFICVCQNDAGEMYFEVRVNVYVDDDGVPVRKMPKFPEEFEGIKVTYAIHKI